jgi:hypothetical protein
MLSGMANSTSSWRRQVKWLLSASHAELRNGFEGVDAVLLPLPPFDEVGSRAMGYSSPEVLRVNKPQGGTKRTVSQRAACTMQETMRGNFNPRIEI